MTEDNLQHLGDAVVMVLDLTDHPILNKVDLEVCGLVMGFRGADTVAVLASEQGAAFFDLDTGFIKEMLRLCKGDIRVVFVGPIPAEVSGDQRLQEFVSECNAGRDAWFVSDLAELEARLVSLR